MITVYHFHCRCIKYIKSNLVYYTHTYTRRFPSLVSNNIMKCCNMLLDRVNFIIAPES